jgi:FkbM family methyltransferase
MLLEAYDRPTLAWLTRLVTKGSVVFDIGAHVGYHALAMARKVGPSGRVYAFEPHPGSARLLMRNARRFPTIEVVNAAVADFDGTALLVPGGGDTSTFHVVASPRGGPALPEVGQAAAHVVPVLRLDSWSEKRGISQIDVAKVDAEGMDLGVLRGMGTLLQGSSTVSAVVECAPHLLARAGVSVGLLLRELSERFDTVEVIVTPDQLLKASEDVISSLARPTGYVNLLARRGP